MSLIFQLISWPMFGIVLLVFGVAPGAVLQVIVLAFPRKRDALSARRRIRNVAARLPPGAASPASYDTDSRATE